MISNDLLKSHVLQSTRFVISLFLSFQNQNKLNSSLLKRKEEDFLKKQTCGANSSITVCMSLFKH